MAKKKSPGKKKQKVKGLNQIENAPNFSKLPRKAEPMPSSFSSPASPSASGISISLSLSLAHILSPFVSFWCNWQCTKAFWRTVTLNLGNCCTGSLQECPCNRDEASSVTLTNFDDKQDGNKVDDSIAFSGSCDKRSRFVLNFYEFPALEAEPIAPDTVSDPCSGRVVHRKVVEQKSDVKKLQVRGSNGVCITPGNAVWAKTACQVWWPAQIIEKRSVLVDSTIQQTEEHVLVKFYGKHDSAWINAARDLSMLEDCFEERSCNLMENFQDALKQAIVQRKKHIKSCRQLPGSPDPFLQSDRQDKKSGLCCIALISVSKDWNTDRIRMLTACKHASSLSSKTGSNLVRQVGNKKEGKPRIHLNGARFPLKSGEGPRRLKIMRYLGLTAPMGSPF
ncbi:thsA [Gossypium australe]|uniref:ThsA n=1 Tax=Gossypium australe TaxID=47621 RepID=A0A5B6V442_9ROSI|nr:thsA [Gossypium australe]